MRNLLIATLLAAMAASPATAEDRNGPQATTIVEISFKDLDLSTAAGLRQLRRRIASGTEAVCGSYAGVEEYERIRINECRAQVGRQVTPQLARVTGTSTVRLSAVERR